MILSTVLYDKVLDRSDYNNKLQDILVIDVNDSKPICDFGLGGPVVYHIDGTAYIQGILPKKFFCQTPYERYSAIWYYIDWIETNITPYEGTKQLYTAFQ